MGASFADWPERLRRGPRLRDVSVEGSLEAERVVAIVGPREPWPGVLEGPRVIAGECARRGIVVASGGARGVDRAAHEGALDAGGVSWAVLPCGADHVSPTEHRALFGRIAQAGGALVWPYAPNQKSGLGTFTKRNEVLVGLADAVIVTQAPEFGSGTQNTMGHAKKRQCPLWVVPPVPWVRGVAAVAALGGGARPLYSLEPLFRSLGLDVSAESGPLGSLPPRQDPTEQSLILALASGPRHPDDLVSACGGSVAAVHRALLTLSLDSVVVDGPDGRYRLCR